MFHRTALLTLLVVSGVAFAQPGNSGAEAFLKADTKTVSENELAGAKSLTQWQDNLPRLREEYFFMLGLSADKERTPLKPVITGTVKRGEVEIDNLHFQSIPGLYVTGNLYRPKGNTKKLPTILYVCGHSGRGRDGNKTAFQDHGMWFARNGYVCLVIDTLQLGEIAGKHHGTYNLNRWWWHSRGYTSAGVECWNGVRAIDYLVTRPDVDAEKIGVTGISGGGAATIWIAAADPRVKVAVPVSGMSDLESYVSNKIINGHCDCMALYNTYRWEWTTIAGLIAPRPMLFANSDNDRIFPMDGNRRIIDRLRRLYKLHGKADLVDEYVSKGGHDYREDLRLAIFRFINKHLKGVTTPIKDADDKPLPGVQLRVFPTDADIPNDAINGRVDEVFVPTATVKLPTKEGYEGWRKSLLTDIIIYSLRQPREVPAARKVRTEDDRSETLQTEGEILVRLSPKLSRIPAGTEKTILILNEDDEVTTELPAWAKTLNLKGEVRLLQPRGGKSVAWAKKSPPNYVARSFALLGKTIDSGRVYDIRATLKYLEASCKEPWRVVGKGPAGILGVYAALTDDALNDVVVVDPPTSHRDGPHFLGIQRVVDIPTAVGMLAPCPLQLIGAKDKAFDRTMQIYKLANAEMKVTRK